MDNSRKIAFRAWSDSEKEMVTDFTARNGGYLDEEGQLIKCAGWEYMQFTGLKDKNGKELYENDIVLFPNNVTEAPQEVLWQMATLRTRNARGWYGDPKSWSEIEIIGNIYENPDLLSNNK